jgi:hypothetical protein
MTVEELIVELQKYPSYCPVFMKVVSPNFDAGGADTDYFRIQTEYDAFLLHFRDRTTTLGMWEAWQARAKQHIVQESTKQVLWKCGYCGKHDLNMQVHMGRCMGSVSNSPDVSLIPQNSVASQPEAVPVVPEGWKLVPKSAVEMLLHKFERAGGPWKVAAHGVELGANSWASNIENALNALETSPPAPTQS